MLEDPVNQQEPISIYGVFYRSSSSYDLEKERAESEDIRERGRLARQRQLRSNVTKGAGHNGGMQQLSIMAMQPCKAEVTKPSIHLAVEENIARLDVSVDHNLLPLFMNVEQA